MMTILKYNHSSTETARNCPTYIQNGALITLQREGARLKHMNGITYIQRTRITVKKVGPGMDLSCADWLNGKRAVS